MKEDADKANELEEDIILDRNHDGDDLGDCEE